MAVVLVHLAAGSAVAAEGSKQEPISPGDKVIKLFNGKDLTGLYTWLKGPGRNSDPQGAFAVHDGMIHVSGEGRGYIATERTYRDYHLIVEYKWGERVDGSGYVRNAGVLLHGTGPDGSHRSGIWMASLECQLAQGCEGDLIVIRGLDENGKLIPVDVTCEIAVAADGKTRWKKGGKRIKYSGKQFWWSKHEPFFQEKLDTRGKDDVASPPGEWTRVECICDGDRVTVKVNGITVNEALDVWPTSGKVLLQNEGNEIYYRRFELHPLKK
jgi:hypothetical protein